MPNDMKDFFALKKRLLLLDAGLDPHVVEHIVDIDLKQLDIMYGQLKNELSQG